MKDFEAATSWIDEGMLLAKQRGKFIFMCLGAKARIMLLSENYESLRKTLIEIVRTERSSSFPDVAPEWDFFENADKQILGDEVVNAVAEAKYRTRRASDR